MSHALVHVAVIQHVDQRQTMTTHVGLRVGLRGWPYWLMIACNDGNVRLVDDATFDCRVLGCVVWYPEFGCWI